MMIVIILLIVIMITVVAIMSGSNGSIPISNERHHLRSIPEVGIIITTFDITPIMIMMMMIRRRMMRMRMMMMMMMIPFQYVKPGKRWDLINITKDN